jgi:hypothetical protein
MKRTSLHLLLVVIIAATAGCSTLSAPAPTPAPSASPAPQSPEARSNPTSPTAEAMPTVTMLPVAGSPSVSPTLPTEGVGSSSETPGPPPPEAGSSVESLASPIPAADPFGLISQDRLFGVLDDLTGIQPYSGWRNSASAGEAEALDYVATKLGELEYLQGLGLELERQSFHVFLATELWETRLYLDMGSQQIEVPVDGLRGPRDELSQALRFDSDGKLNDSQPDPVVVEGPALLVRSAKEIQALRPDDVRDKVVVLDYALVDRSVIQAQEAVEIAFDLLEEGPAGLVLVTHFSNKPEESHGAFVGDLSALNYVRTETAPPILYVRLEDLAPVGIEDWPDLEQIQAVRLVWDADVFAPGTSGNLVARIPGSDPSQAVILGGHIDSPNGPGAMDDGSGSAILLEVARVLDEAHSQPPTDLYLLWFGSEELGLYGARHFVTTHQALLDRTLAMLQIDCLSRPLDGLSADLRLVTWPYGHLGDGRMVWPEALTEIAAERGVETVPYEAYFVYSDNSTFGGFDVPHADLIYEPVVEPDASVHYAGHLHDPYDTVALAREVGDALEEMARVALAAALETPKKHASLRVTPAADRHALFVASHTEATHMTPTGFTELGMALAMEGFDVDLIPYGQAVTPADLEDTDLVVVLPVLDYPTAGGDLDLYDEGWTEEEIDALRAYAVDGGLLVLTNSRYRIKYGTAGLDPNEDWADANALASEFGITYLEGVVKGDQAETEGDHPLVQGLRRLELGPNNGVPFDLSEDVKGQVLASADGGPALVLVQVGEAGGQILALADVALLSAGSTEPQNLPFWQNLARYARSR